MDNKQEKLVEKEKDVLEKIKGGSPFIVEIKESVKGSHASFFVLEYLAGGDLN